MMSTERLFFVVFVGLYLLDCLTFIKPTQAIVIVDRYQVHLNFGLCGYVLRGHVPVLLNPFTPWIPGFRTSTMGSSAVTGGTISLDARPLRRLRSSHYYVWLTWPLLTVHAILIFGALPFFLLTGQ